MVTPAVVCLLIRPAPTAQKLPKASISAGGFGSEPVNHPPGDEAGNGAPVHRVGEWIALGTDDRDMGALAHVPVYRQQIGGGVQSQLAGAAGEGPEQRLAASAPMLVRRELVQAREDDPGGAVR